MKTVCFIFLFTFSINSIYSQDLGDIEVNRNISATLIFSDSISLVVCGNNPKINNKFKYYDIFQFKKICVIRGVDSLAPGTSITVYLHNDKAWCGHLKYGKNTKNKYDYTEEVVNKEVVTDKINQEVQEKVNEKVKETTQLERLNSLMVEKPEYFSFGVKANGMEFQVSNIRNDENYTYIKIIVKNGTGSIYNVDGVYFKYVEGKSTGLKKDGNINNPIFPVLESPIKEIAANKTEELGYIIPLFTVGSNGNLSLQLREANGTRNPLIIIKGSDMLKVKVFEQKKQQ